MNTRTVPVWKAIYSGAKSLEEAIEFNAEALEREPSDEVKNVIRQVLHGEHAEMLVEKRSFQYGFSMGAGHLF